MHSAPDPPARTDGGCPIRVRLAQRSLAAPQSRFAVLRALLRPLAPQASTLHPSPLGSLTKLASVVSCTNDTIHGRVEHDLLVRFGKIEVHHDMRLSKCIFAQSLTTGE